MTSRAQAILDGWRGLAREIARPEDGATPYRWTLIAIGHVWLGSVAAAVVLAADAVVPGVLGAGRVLIAVGYWLVKEWGDLTRGGSLADGLVDAAFVALGGLYDGPAWWPLATAAALALGLTIRFASRR